MVGIYNNSKIYTSGTVGPFYKQQPKDADYIFLNGVRYRNSFYERTDGNVGSSFVDSVRLPDGFEKIDYIAPATISNVRELIQTDFDLPTDSYSIFVCVDVGEIVYTAPPIVSVKYLSSDNRITRIRVVPNSTDFTIEGNNSARQQYNGHIKSAQVSKILDNRFYRKSLLADEKTPFTLPVSGDDLTRKVDILTMKADIKLFSLFITNGAEIVLFTAIPCRRGNEYGIYDLVTKTFYTNNDVTGG